MKALIISISILMSTLPGIAQNPIVKEVFTADPAAIVHDGTVYLYTGHDEAKEDGSFYVMNDWLLFTSTDMVNWTSHGAVFKVSDVSWAKGDAWAGEVEERNGKFYFYFCAEHKSIKGKATGVAVSDSPYGPFVDIGSALITNDMTDYTSTWDDIDPTVYIEDDGQAYMYWGNSQCYYIKLKDNMVETEGDIVKVPLPNFTEAPYIHKHDDTYYLSYAEGWPEKISYATSKSITGPWTYGGVINEENENSGTDHQSIIEFKGQSYFIYHTAGLPTGGDYRRSVAIDYLFYNKDGSIKPIVPTTEGVANVKSTKKCPPVPLDYKIIYDGDGIIKRRTISVLEGENIVLQPVCSEKGTWTWTGPNGFKSSEKSAKLSNLKISESGTYKLSFKNSCGTQSYLSFNLIVNSKTVGVYSLKTYKITHVESGDVLTAGEGKDANGTNILAAPYTNKDYQHFKFTSVDSYFWRISPLNSASRALDVYGISKENNANILLWDYWGGEGQQWTVKEKSPGIYNIIARHSGKCLDYDVSSGNIYQITCLDYPSQEFKLTLVKEED